MKRQAWLLRVVGVLCVLFCTGHVALAEEQASLRVLMLQSHGPASNHGMWQAESAREVVKDRFGSAVTILDEYMQMGIRRDAEYKQSWFEFLKGKYKDCHFDATVLIDSAAVEFWTEYGQRIAPDVPMVFCGLMHSVEAVEQPDRMMTGVMERLDIAGTLRLIRQMAPERDHLVVSVASTGFGPMLREQAFAALAQYPELDVKFVETPTLHDLFTLTEADAARTAVLYFSGWAQAADGSRVNICPAMNERGRVPVFACYESDVWGGAVGGNVVRPLLMGRRAGEMVVRVLEGEHPSSIPITDGGVSQPVVAWNEIRKWGVGESQLPEGTVILGRPEGWAAHHADELRIAAIAGLVVLVSTPWAIVVIVSRNNRLRRDAEAAHQASESYLASIAESLPGMVYRAVVTPDGMVRYPYQSGRAQEIYGTVPEAMKPVGRIGEFCPPEDGERLRALVRRCTETLEPFDIQYRIIANDGTERWVHGLAKATRLPNGDTVFDGIVLDITRQKHAEQALQESRERLEAITRNLPGIVYRHVVTKDMMVHYPYLSQGRQAVTMSGVIETKPFSRLGEFLPPAERHRLQAETLRCIETLDPFDIQLRTPTPEGEERWMHFAATVTRLPNGDTAFDGIGLDMTDKKRSERALQESEKRYYTLYDSNPLPVIVLEASSLQVLDVNSAAEMQYGYTREEFTQLTMGDILPAGDADRLRGMVHLPESGVPYTGTNWRHCRRDGTEFDVLERSHAVRLGDMDVRVSIIQDVTEIRRAEAARRQSEERFRQIAESIREVFWLTSSEDMRVLYVSPAFEQVWGIPCDEVYRSTDTLVNSIHPEDRERFVQAQIGRCGDGEIEYRIVRPDGSVRWIHDRGFPVYDDRGDCIRVAGIAEDITERKATEHQLAQGRAQLESFIVNTPAAVAMFDRHVRYIQTSKRWRDDYGLRDQELLGKSHYDVFPEIGEQWKKVHRRCLAGHVEQCAEDLFVRADGTEQWLRWEVRPWYTSDGDIGGILMLTEDITARRAAEASLRKYAETQRMLLRELDHRVRNAMAGLLAMIDISAPTYSSKEEFASAVRRRVRAMADVHSMLSESRWMPVDLRRLALSLAPPDAEGRVELIGPSVSVPPRQATALGMIIQELMSNATKYGALRQQGGVVQVEWKVLGRDRNGGSMVHLSWRERCPNGCVIEGKPGLGTSLVRGFARSELRGSVAMRFSPHGVEHDFSITFDDSTELDTSPKLAA